MPTFYNFRENGIDYSFDDVFVPADLFRSGNLWVWGNNSSSQLGLNSDTSNKSTPVTTFTGGIDWKQVSAGNFHTAAIKTDGTLWVWGNGSDGRLGTNDTTNRSTPVTTFAGGTNWKQVSAGGQHTSAIKTDGTLWTWGNRTYGRLGKWLLSESYRITPVTTFAGGADWADTPTTEPEDLYTLCSGSAHTAAIKTDGTLWIWGENAAAELGKGGNFGFGTESNTPITTFSGGTNWKQVSCGHASNGAHTAAIKTDGTLWTWGNGQYGQLGNNISGYSLANHRSTPITTFSGGTNWKQVSCGGYHTAAIKTDGTLWTWGYGRLGRLGNNNTTTNRASPITTFAGGSNWKSLSSGLTHTGAIKTDGTLWLWGYNFRGNLGNALDSFVTRATPITTFSGGTDWKQVSCGEEHTAAIKTDGTLWIWGHNLWGQLGNNDSVDTSTPVTTFSGGTDWKQVSCGRYHTGAIKTNGSLWTWGRNVWGQLGINDTINRSTPVTTFSGGTNWKQVFSSVGDVTIGLKGNEILVFGLGGIDGDSLGLNFSKNVNYVPGQVWGNDTNWSQVSSGGNHTAAIKRDGTLWVWGNGSSGKLGNAEINNVISPVTTFAGGNDWKQVSCGNGSPSVGDGYHTSAVKTDGTLWTWGNTINGVLGDGSVSFSRKSTPITTFAGGSDWKQVVSGSYHTAAIKTDGTLWVWGSNNVGAIGTNDLTNRSTPVTTFAGGTNWKQVSAGGSHTLAIKTDGTLWSWGYNGNGTLGINNTSDRSTPVTSFAGGSNWRQVDSFGYNPRALTYEDPVL